MSSYKDIVVYLVFGHLYKLTPVYFFFLLMIRNEGICTDMGALFLTTQFSGCGPIMPPNTHKKCHQTTS